jgi:hypothetical protein
MVVVKPDKEIIRRKINELKLDRVRAKAKNKILSHVLAKMKEGLSLQELKIIMKDKETSKNLKKEYLKNYYYKNRERILSRLKQEEMVMKKKEYDRLKYIKNREKLLRQSKEYSRNNREKINKRNSKRKKTDPHYKLRVNMARRILLAVKGSSKSKSTLELLGCTLDQLKQYIETLFKPGMTWGNHSKFGWHLDHIIPCSSFDLTDVEQQKKCFHYTNLQPLWAKDNIKKGSKLRYETQ